MDFNEDGSVNDVVVVSNEEFLLCWFSRGLFTVFLLIQRSDKVSLELVLVCWFGKWYELPTSSSSGYIVA